jgi:regulator of sirC expression with transglutaminase-like and TPR domain
MRLGWMRGLLIEGQIWLNARSMTDKYSQNTAQQRTYQAFTALVMDDESKIDLAQAALLIASVAYPDLDPVPSLTHLDALARRVRELLSLSETANLPALFAAESDFSPLTVITAINQILFEEEHFHGNKEDYSNPNNSYLNKVLEEHTGLPITLCVLYMEIGKRIGLPIDGMGFPYHFMIRYHWPAGNIYIDPFSDGLILNEQECIERLQTITRHHIPLHPRWLKPVTSRQILLRMLNNLKAIYINKSDFEHALAICDLIIILLPHVGIEQRDRGFLHLELKHYGKAMKDLAAYLELNPEADDRYEIRKHIKDIKQTIAQLN